MAFRIRKPSQESFFALNAIPLYSYAIPLEGEGTREAFQAVAVKEVLAFQIEEAMKTQKLSRRRLAERMGTSRSQIGRLLDPKDGNVTLSTLQRAAEILGRKVRLDLV